MRIAISRQEGKNTRAHASDVMYPVNVYSLSGLFYIVHTLPDKMRRCCHLVVTALLVFLTHAARLPGQFYCIYIQQANKFYLIS